MNTYRERLEGLRALMAEQGLAAYLVPGTDPHQSEYVPEAWQRRRWLSGFTGSRGDVVVTSTAAGLWTDSRYFLQAEAELAGSGIELFPIGAPGVPGPYEWLASRVQAGELVGADPTLLSAAQARELEELLAACGARVAWLERNLIDTLWTDRPQPPASTAVAHELRYAGESVASKLSRVRDHMATAGAGSLAVTALDSIAWLFNLRGGDIEFNPLFIAYALLTRERAVLFADQARLSAELRESLADSVQLEPYERFLDAVAAAAAEQPPLWVDPAASAAVVRRAQASGRVLLRPSPLPLLKAVKNPTEIGGFRRAHTSDGLALVRFLHWLEHAVGRQRVTELSAAQMLETLRSRDPLYRGASFATISAYGEHGAIVHYRPTPETDALLAPGALYLIDSGGHYLDGTTDVTRTVALGEPTAEQRRAFTLVLKAHIRLAEALFPADAKGIQLDALARERLWVHRLDYGHGTGHGVGSYLCVHESPPSLSPTTGAAAPVAAGMVLSIEPGYYARGEYGVRIENLVLTVEAADKQGGERPFLHFEPLTLCPIDLRLIDPALLEDSEIAWLDAYHARVRRELGPMLEPAVRDWLERATRPL